MVKHLFLALTLVSFWMQGLFFAWELYTYTAILAVFFLYISWKHQRMHLFGSKAEAACFLLYTSGYAVHVVMQGSKGANQAFFPVIVVGLTLVLGKTLFTAMEDLQVYYKGIYWNIVALAFGGWWFKGGDLLQSVFGYANALAALCLFAVILSSYFWAVSTTKQMKWSYAAGMLVLLFSLGATEARIAWGICAVSLVVLCIFHQEKLKIKSMAIWLFAVGASCAIIGVFFYLTSLNHFASLLETSSLRLRFTYYWDGWRMIMDYPWLGVGPDGWTMKQYQYQTALYSVKHIHNHFLQVWLDGGVLSFAGYIGFVATVLLDVKILKKINDTRTKSFFLHCWLATLAVCSYSFFDFILSFPALLGIVFFYLIVRGVVMKPKHTQLKMRLHSGIWAIGAPLLLTLSILGLIREWNQNQAETALLQNEIRKALTIEQKPEWMTAKEDRYLILGQAYAQKAKRTKRKSDWEESIHYLHAGISINESNLHFYPLLLEATLQTGKYEENVEVALRLVQAEPTAVVRYENYGYALLRAGKYQKVLEMPQMMLAYKQKVLQNALFPKHIPALKPSWRLKKIMEEALRQIS